MNAELRLDVLKKSLFVEDVLSGLLSILFRFPKSTSKTLGHNSSSISFKTKTDLLRDLNRLTDEQYKSLIMFMEVRNQLIHNLETDSLIKAFDRCNKTNKILDTNDTLKSEFKQAQNDTEKESILKILFAELTNSITEFCSKILNQISLEIDEEETRKAKALEAATLDKTFKLLCNAVDKVSDYYDNFFIGNDENLQKHKGQLSNFIIVNFLKELKEEFPEALSKYQK